MTQSPQSGTAPRTTDFGSAPHHAAHSSATENTDVTPRTDPQQWGAAPVAADPAFGAPVHADAPTGAIPLVGASFPAGVTANGNAPAAATNARSAGQGRARTARSRGPRRARLQLRHINPWTVLKFSCVLSIALFFVWLIVVGVLFGILDAAGIINKINDTVTTLQSNGSGPPVTAGVVFGGAAIIGVVNIVLFVALSTIGSVVYNLCADLVGGVEITLSER